MASDVPNLPIFLNLDGVRCLVVGGHQAGFEKAAGLLACGGVVTVVSPKTIDALSDLDVNKKHRKYRSPEAKKYRLVIAATGILAVDKAVADDAARHGVLVNVVDNKALSSFIMPAIFRQGPVTVAVSTGGKSPAFATWLRDEIAKVAGKDIDALVDVVGDVRARLRASGASSEGRDWRGLINATIDAYRSGNVDDARLVADRYGAPWIDQPALKD